MSDEAQGPEPETTDDEQPETDRTPQGYEIKKPKWRDVLADLEKVAKPKK